MILQVTLVGARWGRGRRTDLEPPAVPHLGPTCPWLEGSHVTLLQVLHTQSQHPRWRTCVWSLALYRARRNQTCLRSFGKWDEERAKDFSRKTVPGQSEGRNGENRRGRGCRFGCARRGSGGWSLGHVCPDAGQLLPALGRAIWQGPCRFMTPSLLSPAAPLLALCPALVLGPHRHGCLLTLGVSRKCRKRPK